MTDSIDPLLRDLVAWIGPQGRLYRDVIDAWRTSCPRLPVWEDANERGLVTRLRHDGEDRVVVTQRGHAFLSEGR